MKLMTDCECHVCKTPWSDLTDRQKEMACAPIHGHPTLLGFALMILICSLVIWGITHV